MPAVNPTHDDIACEIVLAWLPHGARLPGKDLPPGDPKSYEEVGRRIGAVYRGVLKAVEDAGNRRGNVPSSPHKRATEACRTATP